MTSEKRDLIEKTAQAFQLLNEDNKMFVLGYMIGIQQERERKNKNQGPEPPKAAGPEGKKIA